MAFQHTVKVGVTYHDPQWAYKGFTLFTPLGGDGSTFLIDMEGAVVHRWKMPHPGNLAQLLDNGNLMFDCKTVGNEQRVGGGATGTVMEVGWDGAVLWEYNFPYLHHDHCRMENGNTMLLGWEKIPKDMVKKVKGGLPGTEDNGDIWGDFFREVTPEGETVWEWHGHEHLDIDDQIICPLCTRKEWTHANTVEVLPDGDILTSFRLTDTIGIIDKKTGDWKWKWGRGELGHQHDPTLLDNGNILVFDNGAHIPQKPRSRILEVDPKKNEIVWEYSDPHYLGFHSASISGCQRLPNGNTLICEGNRGRLFEVTPDSEIVWEYYSPFYSPSPVAGQKIPGNMVFRAYRYGPDFPGFSGKKMDTKNYDWLNRANGVQ